MNSATLNHINWAYELQNTSKELMDAAVKSVSPERDYMIARAQVRTLQAQTEIMLAQASIWEEAR